MLVLPEPVWPDQRDGLPRLGRELDVLQNPAVVLRRLVAEAHFLEAHLPVDRGQGGATHAVDDLRRCVEQLENPLQARTGRENVVIEIAHRLHRAEEHLHVKDERGEIADGDLVMHHQHAAVAEHDRDPDAGNEAERRHESVEDARDFVIPDRQDAAEVLVPLKVLRFAAHRLHHANARNILREAGRQA